MSEQRSGTRRPLLKSLAVGSVVTALAVGGTLAAQADNAQQRGSTAFALTAQHDRSGDGITGENQGFSVESADFAHGFITKDLLSERLQTLGKTGVIRLGGYSMDLVWPAFGAYKDAPPPPEAIGGVVDQSDFDNLKKLVRDSNWKVTLGVPLKAIIDPAKLKDPTKDPAPKTTLDQVVEEVKAAYKTLGSDLTSVEIGNEYDNVTTLTPAEYYETLKQYYAAIQQALPHTKVKVSGPSANTAKVNTQLEGFVAAVQADIEGNKGTDPRKMFSEISSHYYHGSHCGASNLSIATLMSTKTYTDTQAKLTGIMDLDNKLGGKIPSVLNESNSASCSGQPEVSNSYATSLWALDYQLQAAQTGISRIEFHTNTAAVCGDFKPRTSPEYPISYRYYGAFCAADQAQLDKHELSATPLYYGLWAFRQVPEGHFVDLGLVDTDTAKLRAYGVKGRDGKLTVVLLNIQDPAAAASTDDAVTLNLPGFRKGHAVTLTSTGAGGLASTDASAITLGGQTVKANGHASGKIDDTKVDVDNGSASITVAPGTAQIITFSR